MLFLRWQMMTPFRTLRELFPMDRTVIAFSGKAGAGKSTAANHLISAEGFKRIKWATGLKEMLRAYLRHRGVSPDYIEDMVEGKQKEVPSEYLNGRTPRHAMQSLGDWGRNMHPNLWIDTECEALPPSGKFVSDDTRYPNEAEAIRKLGGIVIRIVRPSRGGLQGEASMHESETHELPADLVLVNDGTVADLLEKVDLIVSYSLRTKREGKAA